DPVELDYVLKAFKSPQALYYFYFKIKKTADKHDFHRVCRQSEVFYNPIEDFSVCTFFSALSQSAFWTNPWFVSPKGAMSYAPKNSKKENIR
ncbi:hypothetical protein NX029_16975, partial [Cytobacillus firmus]|nr:hypothetical protein [Cytobacillus firmus]